MAERATIDWACCFASTRQQRCTHIPRSAHIIYSAMHRKAFVSICTFISPKIGQNLTNRFVQAIPHRLLNQDYYHPKPQTVSWILYRINQFRCQRVQPPRPHGSGFFWFFFERPLAARYGLQVELGNPDRTGETYGQSTCYLSTWVLIGDGWATPNERYPISDSDYSKMLRCTVP